MGKGGNDNDSADIAAGMAKKLWEQTDPARQTIVDQGQEFLEGGYDPTASPLYSPGVARIENQYDVARGNILGNMPSGGQMYDQLGNLEMSRAQQIGNLGAGISQDEYNKIYGLVSGAPQQSLGAMTNLAGSEAARQSEQSAAKSGMAGELGGGLGSMLGMMWCDRRLKKNIHCIGVYNGIPMYEFEYLWSPQKHIGPIAQDLLTLRPEAVFKYDNGYYGVNMGRL